MSGSIGYLLIERPLALSNLMEFKLIIILNDANLGVRGSGVVLGHLVVAYRASLIVHHVCN